MNFLLSCTSDDSSSSNAVNYSFEIEFGGEIHKIQGNLANDIFTSFKFGSFRFFHFSVSYKIVEKSQIVFYS